MRYVAIPDLHLGKRFNVSYGNASIAEAFSLRLVIDIIKKENTKDTTFIFLGDIFERSRPDYHTIFNFLKLLHRTNASIVITGNHDIPKVNHQSVMDYLGDFVTVVQKNTSHCINDEHYAIGWCDTQDIFEKTLKQVLRKKPTTVFLHAAYNNLENLNDNVVPDAMIKVAKKQGTILVSGHEHTHNIHSDTLIHTGSIMPFNIGELGKKYYWTSDNGLVEINHGVGSSEEDDLIITREEIESQGTKPIMIRTKARSSDKLVLEKQSLSVDIMDVFKIEALAEGFDETFIEKYLDDFQD